MWEAQEVAVITQRATHSAAMTPMQKLVSERIAALGLSYRQAAERANGLLSHTTIQRIANGESAGSWSAKTLRGLSLALDVPLSEVEKAAGAPAQGTKFRVPPEWDRLSASERAAVKAVADALLKAHKKS